MVALARRQCRGARRRGCSAVGQFRFRRHTSAYIAGRHWGHDDADAFNDDYSSQFGAANADADEHDTDNLSSFTRRRRQDPRARYQFWK